MGSIGPEARAWLVFTTPMDPSCADPRQARSAAARRHMRSNGGLLNCVQITAVPSVYTHVYVLLGDGAAFSISLNEGEAQERQWTSDKVRQTRRIDQMDAGASFKVYRRITDVPADVERLGAKCRSMMAKARYPKMAYWVTMLLGRVVPAETIVRYTAGPDDMTCSMFAFVALRDGGMLAYEEGDRPPMDFSIPDNLEATPTVRNMLEDTADDVADFIGGEAVVGVSATQQRRRLLPLKPSPVPAPKRTRGVDVTDMVRSDFTPP